MLSRIFKIINNISKNLNSCNLVKDNVSIEYLKFHDFSDFFVSYFFKYKVYTTIV